MDDNTLDNLNSTESGLPAPDQSGGLDAAALSELFAGVDRDNLMRCTHCGLCTSSCPTFAVTGDENDGPRGRIQIMRMAMEKGDRAENGDRPLSKGGLSPFSAAPFSPRMLQHLDRCLDCYGCETVCPSGVQYGKLIEPLRVAIGKMGTSWKKGTGPFQKGSCPHFPSPHFPDWFREIFLFRLLPYPERLRRALAPVRFLQHTGILDLALRLGLLKIVPGRLGRMISLLPPPIKPGPKLPKFLPAVGRTRARVAFFTGCVADAVFRHVHWATLRVLQQNGCDIFIPPEQGCCGALNFQAGDGRGARKMADANLVAFELDRYDAIVVNHAGCGTMLKQYGQHWHDGLQPHRAKFASKVKDVHELLDDLGVVPPGGRIDAVATYHDACHLAHAQGDCPDFRVNENGTVPFRTQGIVAAPRRLLEKIPGLQLRELPESDMCCGSAGVYNIQQAEMGDRLARRKLENIISTGASIVIAANAGCLLQIFREARRMHYSLNVLHTMELLDMSYRGEQP
jgi:glycolate oxidase iron-sulfur subunit